MKGIPYILLLFLMLGLSSCTSVEPELGGVLGTRGGHIHRFYATTEQSSPETKVYADEKLRVLWNSGDLLTIFNKSTYNSQFQFIGEDGDNAGDFDEVPSSGFHSGNPLSNYYAVYPYASGNGNTINNDGDIITLMLPTVQYYKEHSFGVGANTMVAVSSNTFLPFKNLGGYLQLRLYGDDVKVSRITIQGNNGEKIAGKANVVVGLGVTPSVTMDVTATATITLVCDPPVQLGTAAEQYTDFWFVIPPVSFEGGFTITVTDELGGVFQKTTTKSLTISRSTIEWMAALEVTPNYDNVNVIFEDANFKAYCVENFDKDNDGEISRQEALLVTIINCAEKSIKSLSGIEHFVSLTSLDCSSNQLTRLDVSHNTSLTRLFCNGNQFTCIDVSQNTALTAFWCQNNQLTRLDVSHNTALTVLYCYNNQLTNLDMSHNTALKTLACFCNQLTSLDMSHNTALTFLDCCSNQLTSLDVTHNTALTTLPCHSNQLTSLDVSQNIALGYLDCNSNQLTSLNVSHNTALNLLFCSSNRLTSLDVSNNIKLTQLRCISNPYLTVIWLNAEQTINDLQYDSSVATIKYRGQAVADAVDLGLSVKWATCNVGATSPGYFGSYFAWGEISPKSDYSWTTYRFRTSGDSGQNVTFSKYNTQRNRGEVDFKTVLDLSDDAARVNWGDYWRIPTRSEFLELMSNCTWTWTIMNGNYGYKVTSKINGNSIFLPAAGAYKGTILDYAGEIGVYSTSSLWEDDPRRPWHFFINSRNYNTVNSRFRYDGQSVRPVYGDLIYVSNVSLDNTILTVAEGRSFLITATVYPSDASDKTVWWSSSNESIATVSKGIVTAHTIGTATITAKAGDETATCIVTVRENVAPESIVGLWGLTFFGWEEYLNGEFIDADSITLDPTDPRTDIDKRLEISHIDGNDYCFALYEWSSNKYEWKRLDNCTKTIEDNKIFYGSEEETFKVSGNTLTITVEEKNGTRTRRSKNVYIGLK